MTCSQKPPKEEWWVEFRQNPPVVMVWTAEKTFFVVERFKSNKNYGIASF